MKKENLEVSRRSFLKFSATAGAASTLAVASGSLLGVKEALAAKKKKEVFPIYFDWDRPIFPKANPKYVLRMAHTGPPNPYTVTHQTQAVVFKNIIERSTNGKIRVDISPAAGVGHSRDIIQQAKDGTIQGSITAEGSIPIFFPPFHVLSIPYVFKTNAVAWQVLDGWFGNELMTQCLKETGLRCIALAENGGFRNFVNNRRPIHTPKDVNGLKFRVQMHEGHMQIIKALGGSAHPIPITETYVGIQTNVIDGLELPVPVINIFKIQEVAKYLTLDGHVYGIDVFFINDRWFKKLPDDYQRLIIEAGYQSVIASRGACRLQEWENLAKMQSYFKEIYIPSPKEHEMFVEASQPGYLEWYHKKIDQKQTWSKKLYEAVEEGEAWVWGKGRIYC